MRYSVWDRSLTLAITRPRRVVLVWFTPDFAGRVHCLVMSRVSLLLFRVGQSSFEVIPQ